MLLFKPLSKNAILKKLGVASPDRNHSADPNVSPQDNAPNASVTYGIGPLPFLSCEDMAAQSRDGNFVCLKGLRCRKIELNGNGFEIMQSYMNEDDDEGLGECFIKYVD